MLLEKCLQVFLNVVESAEEFSFLDVGSASVGPMGLVMNVAPWRGSVASGCGAVAVSGVDSSTLGGRPDPGFASDIEDLGVRPQDDAAQ